MFDAIRVLYLYNTPRGQVYRQSLSGEGSDDLLYGINHLSEFAVAATFFDDGFTKNRLSPFFKLLHHCMASQTDLGFSLEQSLKLRSRFNNFDLIFTTADSCGLPVAMLKCCGFIRKPVVYASIGLTERMRGRQATLVFRFYKKILTSIDKIVYYGYQEGKDFVQLFNIPKHKLEFVPFGVDVDFLRPSKEGLGDFVLSAGRDACRDFTTFLAALEGLDVPVRLVTSPGRLEGLRIPFNVEVAYNIPITELRDCYVKSKFVVVPVRDNAYSAGTVTLLGAMSTGKAVIVSRTGAIRAGYEHLRDGENCLLVEPGDVFALRQAVLYLWENPQQAERIGAAARRTVEEHYTAEQFAARLAAIFKEVIERSEYGAGKLS
jgi:glycosyltransferase involved in cell wall biosynthesis